jgi:hypothetical protein
MTNEVQQMAGSPLGPWRLRIPSRHRLQAGRRTSNSGLVVPRSRRPSSDEERAPSAWRVLLPFFLFLVFVGTPDRADAQSFGEIGGRAGVPEWEVDPAFKHDVFTFARVRYTSGRRGWGGGFGRSWGRNSGRWAIDYPDAELNLAFRLQQMTSMKVNPDAEVVDLAEDDLSRFPFLYIVEPGYLVFSEEEVTALRSYLLNGGFLMIDDFWGVAEWENIEYEMKRVFPDREFVDLPIEHPIFHCVFDLTEKPQVPGIAHLRNFLATGATWERDEDPAVRYYGIFDDRQRMMSIICRNTDLGDGWEREGESEIYFREFAEKKAYPMAINIIFYAMTH